MREAVERLKARAKQSAQVQSPNILGGAVGSDQATYSGQPVRSLRQRLELQRDLAIEQAHEMATLIGLLGDGTDDQMTEDILAAFGRIY